MKRNGRLKTALIGYVAFFATIAAVVTAAVLAFAAAEKRYGDDRGVLALVMLAVCFGLSLACTVIDAVRRRLTVNAYVEEILLATERITSGDFTVRLTPRHPFDRYDDLDLIAVNLNKTAEALGRNESINADFVSNVSHEIKTPLSIISSYAAALQNEALSRDERDSYARTVLEAAKRLTALVTNVLKLSKLENQKLDPELEVLRLDEIIAQSVFGFDDLIERKRLELDCDLAELTAFTSPTYLEIVVNNLLSNAIKFSPEGGKIVVALSAQGKNAVLTVADEGIGMTEETGKRIFDKFYQGDSSHAKEGNGLGLALVKRVIDVLGGEIAVESAPNEGSTFVVTLKGVLVDGKK